MVEGSFFTAAMRVDMVVPDPVDALNDLLASGILDGVAALHGAGVAVFTAFGATAWEGNGDSDKGKSDGDLEEHF